MRQFSVVVALLAAAGLGVSSAYAGPGCCSKKKAEAQTAKSGCSASKSDCSLGAFPSMVQMVGDEAVECPMAAKAMAEKNDTKVVFAVGSKKFESMPEAVAALAEAREDYVKKFTSIACVVDGKVKFCESSCAKACGDKAKMAKADGEMSKSGCDKAKAASTCKKDKSADSMSEKAAQCAKGAKFMVAGRQFDTWEQAAKARDEVVTAVRKVRMTYLVDGKEVDCSSKVCPKAKEAGKVQYKVAGETLKCGEMARSELAKAQYEAAKSALEKTAVAKAV